MTIKKAIVVQGKLLKALDEDAAKEIQEILACYWGVPVSNCAFALSAIVADNDGMIQHQVTTFGSRGSPLLEAAQDIGEAIYAHAATRMRPIGN